eukprot:scaffold2094_cov227-Ochromonas_danica.AAC.3
MISRAPYSSKFLKSSKVAFLAVDHHPSSPSCERIPSGCAVFLPSFARDRTTAEHLWSSVVVSHSDHTAKNAVRTFFSRSHSVPDFPSAISYKRDRRSQDPSTQPFFRPLSDFQI